MIEWLDTPLGQQRATLPLLYLFSQLIFFIIYTNQDRLYDYLVKEELKFFSIIFLQCHTFLTALNYIIQWVSMWTLWDYYASDDWLLMLIISIASILAIIVLTGHTYNLVCSPFIMSYDSIEYNVRIETSFITEKMSPFLLHILNYIFYEYIISLLSILVWHGSYTLLDVFLYPSNDIMKTASSINGPMSHINDEYNLFPLYSNCFLIKWFNRKKKSNEHPSALNKITNAEPFIITFF
ncbi:unnamed protein product [Rotaria sp. Silwood1]|nr:unnamed protein product [Rotaria sp. Silwood1]